MTENVRISQSQFLLCLIHQEVPCIQLNADKQITVSQTLSTSYRPLFRRRFLSIPGRFHGIFIEFYLFSCSVLGAIFFLVKTSDNNLEWTACWLLLKDSSVCTDSIDILLFRNIHYPSAKFSTALSNNKHHLNLVRLLSCLNSSLI